MKALKESKVMLVKAMVKTKTHPQPEGPGAQKGDIIYLWPLAKDHGDETFNYYMSIIMDLTIPCGFVFNIQPPPCAGCEHNLSRSCDKTKLEEPLFDPITFEVIKKRRHKVDVDALLSTDSKSLVYNEEKTAGEKETMLSRAIKNPISKTIITDKEPV